MPKKGLTIRCLHLTSARVFEVIDGYRIGTLYLFIVMPLTLPLAAGYFIYHTVKVAADAQAGRRHLSAGITMNFDEKKSRAFALMLSEI
nr:Uncharacterised protein [Raoultella sp. NCTC 9187]